MDRNRKVNVSSIFFWTCRLLAITTQPIKLRITYRILNTNSRERQDMDSSPIIVMVENRDITIAAISTVVLGVIGYLVLQKSSGKSGGDDISVGMLMSKNAPDTTANVKVMSALKFKDFKLIKSTAVSHNTKLLRFELPSGRDLALPIGRHVLVAAEINGSRVMRPYTPTSVPTQKDYFELLIKEYNLGKMSTYLCGLEEGAMVQIRGPTGRYKYQHGAYTHYLLLAAGTGITPMLQLIRSVLEKEEEAPLEPETRMTLLFQNREPRDVLLAEDLDAVAESTGGRVRVVYCCSKPTQDWKERVEQQPQHQQALQYLSGHLEKDVVAREMALEDEGARVQVGLCGPGGFTTSMKDMVETIASGYEGKTIDIHEF